MVEPIPHTVAAVIPVYRGAASLPALIGELQRFTETAQTTPGGRTFQIVETVLVYDNGPDESDVVIRALSSQHPTVRAVWLSRNFGQHAATMAGMASTTADWILTLDEDGQHDPSDLPGMLDAALDQRVPVLYGRAINTPPHPPIRNITSKGAKFIANNVLLRGVIGDYSSFRLLTGEIGRSVAAYSGHGTYLDVALSWIASGTGTAPITLRVEADRPSGYNTRSLLSHFWRLVMTSGTRPLRLASGVGAALALLGMAFAVFAVIAKLTASVPIAGWTSVVVVTMIGFGSILLFLGVMSEYIGVGVKMAMGRPPYLIVSDPALGPLGRADATQSGSHG